MRGNPNVHPSRRFGHVPDPDGHLTTPVHHLLGAPGALPKSVDLRPHVFAGPGILDQLFTSSCVGHSIDGSIESRLAFLGQKVAHRSPFCIYDAARCIDRGPPNPDGSFDPLVDEGSMPNQAMRGLSLWGVCPYKDRPTSNETVNDEPNLAELQDAHAFRLSGVYEITTSGSTRLAQMKQALAQGFFVPLATFAGRAFQEYNPARGPLTAPDRSDPTGGGHYIYAAGYDTTLVSGITVVFLINSWGENDWGIRGTAEADEAFVEDATDLYVADVHILGPDGKPMRSAA